MALQRNLKALGTFGYQTTARRNPVYIQYIPRTLRYVRDNLEHLPRFGRMRELLGDARRGVPLSNRGSRTAGRGSAGVRVLQSRGSSGLAQLASTGPCASGYPPTSTTISG